MTKCSIISCGFRKKSKNISFHRLPRNQIKKQKWLELIGTEHIRPSTKEIFICSLHFEESSFNRTLNITKLRDDALPTRLLQPYDREEDCIILTENRQELIPPSFTDPSQSHISQVFIVMPPPENCPILTDNKQELILPSFTTPSQNQDASSLVKNVTQSIAGTSKHCSIPDVSLEKFMKLKEKCQHQRLKIKRLNEKIRRQNKKITDFENITKDRRERNLLIRQLIKSRGVPVKSNNRERLLNEHEKSRTKLKNKYIIVQD